MVKKLFPNPLLKNQNAILQFSYAKTSGVYHKNFTKYLRKIFEVPLNDKGTWALKGYSTALGGFQGHSKGTWALKAQ